MKEYTINLYVGAKIVKSYRSTLIPSIGDTVALTGTNLFSVQCRVLPSEPGIDNIVCFGKMTTHNQIITGSL